MPPLPPLPRWFWLLPVAALGLWWPIEPYWQSDDFLALHYAQDLGRALADFVGPQYGSSDTWLFYRPLITLSFWFDQQLAGAAPWFSHFSNAAAHAVSALLAGLLLRRWLPAPQAFLAVLWWACLPSHAGSIAWAVGRVDSHTTVWCLAACWATARAAERRAAGQPAQRAGMLLATTLALCSKELAFVVPALSTLVAATRLPGTLRQRLAAALGCTWPLWLLLAGFLAARWPLLGRFGGYAGTHYEPAAMANGLLVIVANLLAQLRWTGPDLANAWPAMPAVVWWWTGTIAAAATGLCCLCSTRRTFVALLAFAVACVPMAGFFGDPGNLHNLRYFYLPTVPMALALAGSGVRCMALLLVATLPGWAAMRWTQWQADCASAAEHRALLDVAAASPPPAAPMFVAGLPHANARGTVVQLHFGVDRMLEPPFGSGGIPLYAHRPLAVLPGVVALGPADQAPLALPEGSTWWFRTATELVRVGAAAAAELPELQLERSDGEPLAAAIDLRTPRLHEWTAHAAEWFANRTPGPGLRTPGTKPMGYRVTIFTANGYLGCLCFDYGLAGPQDGWIDWLRFLARDAGLGIPPAVVATAGNAWAGEALMVPTAIDREPTFPALIEAGSLDPATQRFTPTHRARRLLWLRFDRHYPSWVRLVQGR